MLQRKPVAEQISVATADPVRVLIVGAGMAGLTLAQLLRRDGLHPVLVERAAPRADPGYMLALMPLVDPVFDRLGLTGEYLARSERLARYRIRGRDGSPVREYAMTDLLDRFGDYRGISRGAALEVLSSLGGTVTHECTVTAIDQDAGGVRATISDGAENHTAEFDVVIAADGLHSATRSLVLEPSEVDIYDTGWGGWVAWMDTDAEPDLGEELWGAGAFVGSYPVRDRIGILVGGPRAETAAGPAAFVARVRSAVTAADGRVARVLDRVATEPDEQYFWPLTDCRSARWSTGRVVLLGDAAAGFLPTAGIGACMAMESALALAGQLRDTTPAGVPQALRAFELAQRPRVESAQQNSRQLAKLLFRRSGLLAAVRDIAARYMPLELALRPIRTLLAGQEVTAR